METLKKHILQLEKDLLKSNIRKSPEKIGEILAEDFTEYTSTGKVYHYSIGDVFQQPDDETEFYWSIVDFNIFLLSENCILATYKVIKNNEPVESEKYSLRSSIWKNYEGKWKIFFHQGTITSE